MWNYYKGDQPVLYRTKLSNEDIINKIVENHAYEWVQFKVGQSYGEPIQFISRKDDETINKAVDKLNDFMTDANKQEKDIKAGEWQSATGTSFKAAQPKKGDVPFRIVVPTPLNTYAVYNESTEEQILVVQELKDEDGNWYKMAFSDTMSFRIIDSKVVEAKLHTYGEIPIVEFPNNHERLSDIELIVGMLDATNNMQSNRMDSIQQFVEYWVKFVNCEVDEETFKKMKENHALVVKSMNKDNKSDVDIMTQELNQTQVRRLKKYRSTAQSAHRKNAVRQWRNRTVLTRNWKVTMKNAFLNAVSALCRKWLMNLQNGTDGNMERMRLRDLTSKRGFALESHISALYKNYFL